MRSRFLPVGLPALVLCAIMLLMPAVGQAAFIDLWWTPEQQAQRLLERGDCAGAAARYVDPMRSGAAWYCAGDFERAAAAFGRLDSAAGHFNRGNALVLLGKYADAIAAYDAALTHRPGWQPAAENRALALARQERLARPDDDAGGTGGMLGADEVVFDSSPHTSKGGSDVTEDDGPVRDDAQMRELWLRRVETRPADFLRARFARQLANQADTQP